MELKEELKVIKDSGIILHKSKKEGHLFFLPAIPKELPKGMSFETNVRKQSYGTHYTELGIQLLAKSLKSK